MSTAAKAKGIPAAIIDGGCRDISEHRVLGYPVSSCYSDSAHELIGRSSRDTTQL